MEFSRMSGLWITCIQRKCYFRCKWNIFFKVKCIIWGWRRFVFWYFVEDCIFWNKNCASNSECDLCYKRETKLAFKLKRSKKKNSFWILGSQPMPCHSYLIILVSWRIQFTFPFENQPFSQRIHSSVLCS